MANKQFIGPANRAFTGNGFPAPGATLSLYLSGTLTPANFYADDALTTSLGPTLTANGAGRFEDAAYQDEFTAFRVIYRDELGVQLDDIDPFFFGYEGPRGPQGIQGDVAKVLTRTDLAATAIGGQPSGLTRYLVEDGRQGIFVWSTDDLSAQVTADTGQGIYVPPASGQGVATDGSDGAWVRKFSGPLNVKWFGAIGDGSTSDYAAFAAALAFVRDNEQPQYNYGYGAYALFVPAGRYMIGPNALDIYGSVRLMGENTGFTGGSASVLIFTGATTGIRIQSANTIGDTGSGTTGFPTGAGAIIEHLGLQGGYTGTESESHGIHIRAPCILHDVVIRNFPGDGVYANCALGAGGALEGQSNVSRFVRVWTEQNRNGFYLQGADSNASLIDGCSSVANRQWGYFDDSFLGNFYRGCHTRTNGAGAYRSDPSQLNAACTFSDCYSESDQPPSVFAARTLLVGGFHAAGGSGGAGISVADGKLTLPDAVASGTFTAENDLTVVGALSFASASIAGKWAVDTNGNIVSFGTTGLTLNGSGAAVHIGGDQVVGARQFATAADANDLASVITLANRLKAQLIAHGLIG